MVCTEDTHLDFAIEVVFWFFAKVYLRAVSLLSIMSPFTGYLLVLSGVRREWLHAKTISFDMGVRAPESAVAFS